MDHPPELGEFGVACRPAGLEFAKCSLEEWTLNSRSRLCKRGPFERFEEVVALLDDLDMDAIWTEATETERQVLVQERRSKGSGCTPIT